MDSLSVDREVSPKEHFEAYWPIWHEYYTRNNRAEGLDSNIARSWTAVAARMNEILDLIKVGHVDESGES